MAFSGMVVTNNGRIALTKAQNGSELKFKSVGIGDGIYTGSYNDVSQLSNQLFEAEIKKINLKDDICVLEIDISNAGLAVGYYLREIGIYAMDGNKKVLYAYTNAGTDAEYIQAETSVSIEKRIRLSLIVSGVDNINTELSSVLYVTEQDFNGHLSARNPHSVTKADVGLANANNTSDENKPVSAAQQAALNGKMDYTIISSPTAIKDLNVGIYYSKTTRNFTDAPAAAGGECTVFVQKQNNITNVGLRAVLVDFNNSVFICDDDAWVQVKDFTTDKDTKLTGIAAGANKYIHPSAHAASMITQDSTHRFVSDTEKNKVAKLQTDGTVIRYGVCSTASGTTAKTVSITNFSLMTGAKITVKFGNGITCENATLNVSGTGAKPIYYKNAALHANYVKAGTIVEFVYTGSDWQVAGDLLADPRNGLARILWRGGLMQGSVEFNVPMECFYNNGTTLTLQVDGYYPQMVGLDGYGNDFGVTGITLFVGRASDFGVGSDPSRGPYYDTAGNAVATVYRNDSTSGKIAKTNATITCRKVPDTRYATCVFKMNMNLQNTAVITCISAITFAEMEV